MMRYLVLLTIFFVSQWGLSAQSIEGDWHGVLEAPGVKLRLVFHIQKQGEGLQATMDSPDQGALGLAVREVTFKDGQLTLQMPNLGIVYEGKMEADQALIKGIFQQGGARLPLNLDRQAREKEVIVRSQEPRPPFPYTVEDVRFDNAEAGLTLAGTLTLPAFAGPYPAVVLISGSGPQNRDEEILGHKPFLVIADHLTRQGIAVLRFDDRGVGKSTGDFKTATSEDFATDVKAALDYLKNRPDISKDKLGLIGHSEGALIAPMVAAGSGDVAFMVMLAGPGVRGDDILMRQTGLISRAEGESPEMLAFNLRTSRRIYKALRKSKDPAEIKAGLKAYMLKEWEKLPAADRKKVPDADQLFSQQLDQLTSPWFRFFLSYDPRPALSKVRCPVLVMNGGKDLQVDPAQNLPAIEAALKKGGNSRYTIRELPGLNHLFQTTQTGKLSEYGELDETFAPAVLEEMDRWIRVQVQE